MKVGSATSMNSNLKKQIKYQSSVSSYILWWRTSNEQLIYNSVYIYIYKTFQVFYLHYDLSNLMKIAWNLIQS